MYFDKKDLRKRGLIWKGNHLPYNPNLVEKAKGLRRNMTPAEQELWYRLLRNFPFRVLRQRPIDNYIVDFYCPKLKLVIEVDGAHHERINNIKYDNERTKILQAYSLKVVRLKNRDILNDFSIVKKKIRDLIPLQFPLKKGDVLKGQGDN